VQSLKWSDGEKLFFGFSYTPLLLSLSLLSSQVTSFDLLQSLSEHPMLKCTKPWWETETASAFGFKSDRSQQNLAIFSSCEVLE
jgi:hypothetical protein